MKLNIKSRPEFEDAEHQLEKWRTYNTELLTRLFSNQLIATRAEIRSGRAKGLMSFERDVQAFKEEIADRVARLESVLERLPLIPEGQFTLTNPSQPLVKNIFIVHGHDEATKESVARFIEKIGLTAIILHEQPNAGRTIIEKFEDYSTVGFAIVLLMPMILALYEIHTVSSHAPAKT